MFESMTIAFREGMEAFLIVAISLAYLLRTGRPHLARPVYYGIGAAIVASTVLGLWLQDIADNPMTEGVLALCAGALVGSFTVYMLRAAKNIGGQIRGRLETQATKEGFWAAFGVFAFVTLMITREGMETVLMMSAASYETTFAQMMMGIVLGIALAALMGYAWVRKSDRINIGRFLQVSAIFLVLFSVQMFLKGLHELSETGNFAILSQGMFHELTEELAEDEGFASQLITYALVALPLGWLALVSLRDRLTPRSAPAAAE